MYPGAPQVEALVQSSTASSRIASSADRMSRLAETRNARAIREAAEEFEAVFLSEMLAPVFEQLESDGLFGGGSGERMYRSMLVQEYGRAMARNGGVGIADAVQREILRLQEAQA